MLILNPNHTLLPMEAPQYVFPFQLGAACNSWSFNQWIDQRIIRRHFNLVTPELGLVLGRLCPARGVFEWREADDFMWHAQQNSLKVRFFALCWNAPSWLFSGTYAEMLTWLTEICDAIVTRYGATAFESIVMFNEMLKFYRNDAAPLKDNADPGHEHYNPFYTKAAQGGNDGRRYLKDISVIVRAKWPTAKLGWLDGFMDSMWETTKNFETALTYQISQGMQLDWIGSQHHVGGWSSTELLRDNTAYFLNLARAKGKKARICEADFSFSFVDEGDTMDPVKLAHQAALVEQFMVTCLQNADIIEEVGFWGVTDAWTWLTYYPTVRTDYPLLFDRNGHPKLAWFALGRALGQAI